MYTFLLFECLFVCYLNLRRLYQIVLKLKGNILKTLILRPPPNFVQFLLATYENLCAIIARCSCKKFRLETLSLKLRFVCLFKYFYEMSCTVYTVKPSKPKHFLCHIKHILKAF